MSITNHGNIVALREQLFASMQRLSAEKIDPKELGRAKAIAETAQVIINSAKVEVDFIRATGNPGGSGFIPLARPPSNGAPAAGAKPKGITGPSPDNDDTTIVARRPGVTVTQHRLRG